LVHSSLRAIGCPPGGGREVLRALRAAVGPDGTVLVPAFTVENSDTSDRFHGLTRAMSAREAAEFRSRMPAFDVRRTPVSPTIGALAELVRTAPGAVRSAHPQTSFAALGRRAGHLVAEHDPACHLGEASPLGRLYGIPGAQVLMLGAGFAAFTGFHLAEYRQPDPPRRSYRCVVRDTGGRPHWWEYEDVVLDDRDFSRIGAAFSAEFPFPAGPFGGASAALVPFADAVDFGAGWIARHRPL
jgi:aminoglycoside 3-N-acetyltransferase